MPYLAAAGAGGAAAAAVATGDLVALAGGITYKHTYRLTVTRRFGGVVVVAEGGREASRRDGW